MTTGDAGHDAVGPESGEPLDGRAAADPWAPPSADAAAAADPWAPPGVGAAAPTAPAAGAPAGPWAVPAGGYPGWPQSGYPMPGTPQEAPGTNAFAIASLVTGLTCCLWPLALGFGVTALVQLKKRRQRGRGLAVAGVVLGGLGLLGTLTVGPDFATGFNNGLHHRSGLPTSTRGTVDLFTLKVGDCFNESKSVGGTRVKLVPCTSPHYGEVAATVQLGGAHYPGADSVTGQVTAYCDGAEDSYITDLWAQPASARMRYFYPEDRASWDAGDRSGVCFLHDHSGSSSTSLRRDSSDLTADQIAFLQAVQPIDAAIREQDDPSRDWLGRLTTGVSLARISLQAHTWPAGAAGQVTSLCTLLDAQQAVLRKADPAQGGTPLTDQAAQDLLDALTTKEAAARSALDLADQPDDSSAGGSAANPSAAAV